MIAELGHFALILALVVAMVQTVVPMLGLARRIPEWTALAAPGAWCQFLLVAFAYGALTHAFVDSDFTVAYVAQNSNARLPMFYKVTAVWGAHEGSILLWSLILSLWTVAVAALSRSLPVDFRTRVLSIMGGISVGFLLFILATSNPFKRLLPGPAQGGDLNPLLQDPGMIAHPPILYMGYVGLAVPFAFACAALLGGRLDAAWTRWTRPWTTVAWVFLTVGITIGSWWAYSELGWGGWWFWDPVENASFMPWLVATALVHSLAVTEQRAAFKAWTVLLALFGFSLSLVGTFLVRSGVLVSVHAFATDPTRGSFILAFLAVVVGGALVLFAWRAHLVSGGGQFAAFSRETLLLINNVLLIASAGAILLGTLYPLIYDAAGLGKLSVGPPYFVRVFVPLMVPLVLLMGIGPLSRWKSDRGRDVAARVGRLAFPVVALIALGSLLFAGTSVAVAAALALAGWVAWTTLIGVAARVRNRRAPWRALRELPRGFVGMTIAHLGVAVFVVGVTLTSATSIERDVRLAPGESATLGPYEFRLEGVRPVTGPNYEAIRGSVAVFRDGAPVARLEPEKRQYPTQAQPMTEAAVDAAVTRDLYVSLGEVREGGAWTLRVQVKPFIRWIWAGPLLMGLGGLIAASDRRYRRRREPAQISTPALAAAGGD